MGNTSPILQEVLESEYPLLDSSLLAALVSDLPSKSSKDASLDTLRHILAELSLAAQSDFGPADSAAAQGHSVLETDEPLDSENSASCSTEKTLSTSDAGTASTCPTSAVSDDLVLDFLQILFPHLPRSTLYETLHEYSDPCEPSDEPDLSSVVDHLLDLEFIQDLAERGLEDEDVELGVWVTRGKHGNTKEKSKDVELHDWYADTPRRKRATAKGKTKSRAHRRTIAFTDVRKRHMTPVAVSTSSPSSPSLPPPTDPWTRLTSLGTRLSELLPSSPPGFFMSFFHTPPTEAGNKPGWIGEGDALRKALSDIATRSTSATASANEDIVGRLCEVICGPETNYFEELDQEQHERLAADALLCLMAAQGDFGAAIDLVWLLRELDESFDNGEGVAHAVGGGVHSKDKFVAMRLPPLSTEPALVVPSGPSGFPPPPPQKHLPPRVQSAPASLGWTVVERRRPPKAPAHPHSEFIPAYAKNNLHKRPPAKGTEDQIGKCYEKGSASWYFAQMGEFQRQRSEALHEATRHWKMRNAKGRGGEVAIFYAERARELQERQKNWALDTAREMMEESRSNGELDLHGLTVSEACVLVKEALAAATPAPGTPLKIITGRGRHSPGRVSVLGPAVLEMLCSEGWRVRTWEGGLTVHGRV